MRHRAGSFLTAVFLACAPGLPAETLTIAPRNPVVQNCYPFGAAHPDTWLPFAGWIYKNVPPFKLRPGDILAFDLGRANDVPMEIEIALAPATSNGSKQEASPFVTVVHNDQKPGSLGDTAIGNFEVRYTVEAPFDFAGGGLIMRFGNPSGAYQLDPPCDQVQVKATSSDPSGYFLYRVFNDVDGVFPWSKGEDDNIGGFRVITRDPWWRRLVRWTAAPAAALVFLGTALWTLRRWRARGRRE